MSESLRKIEEKCYPDLDQNKYLDQSKDLDLDQSKDSSRDSSSKSPLYRETSSHDDFVYVQKPTTNNFKFEACNQELTQKNSFRHNQPLKHKKNERIYNRNKIIESAKEDRIEASNEDIEQNIDKIYPELEGIKYCDSCDIYVDNNTEHAKHMDTLKHRNKED